MIWRTCYSNRYEAQRSVDFTPGADINAALDRAMLSAAENIEGALHRVFFPSDDTRFFDWPNQGGSGGGQYADPWRLWLDENDIACMASLASGGVSIPLSAVFLEPVNNPQQGTPCFQYLELDRGQVYAFGGQSPTPQHNIMIAGTWGYGAHADPAGTLAAAVLLGDATVTVTDGSKAGPGDLVVLGYARGDAPFPQAAGYAGAVRPFEGERVLITDALPVVTGLTQDGSGVTSELPNDQALTWTGTGQLNAGEVITLDQEDMLVERVTSSVATVRRAFNGTTLASHSGSDIYAMRQWSVLRAQLGTTAAAYEDGAAVFRHRVPQLVRDLSIAETSNQLLQEGSGYARTVGSGDMAHPAPGIALADKWAEASTRHGRHARQRGI